MLTGYGTVDDDTVTAMKEGALHFLTKPVALSEFKVLLDEVLTSELTECMPPFYPEGDNA